MFLAISQLSVIVLDLSRLFFITFDSPLLAEGRVNSYSKLFYCSKWIFEDFRIFEIERIFPLTSLEILSDLCGASPHTTCSSKGSSSTTAFLMKEVGE